MPHFLRSMKALKSKIRKPLGQVEDARPTYILRLPSELLLEIMELLWNSAFTEADRLSLMHCLPLVCKDIAAAFDRVSQREVRIASAEFYKYYMRRLSKVDRSHPRNTDCKSLCFDVDLTGKERTGFPFIALQPLFMGYQEDPLGYFNNGKEFHVKGLLPNLTNIFIHVHNCWIRDPYHVLFPHCMPRTVHNLHISYTFRVADPGTLTSRCRLLEYLRRFTPIRYPSIPHKLKTLSVSGLRGRIDIARVWESLFKIEKFIVDDQVLPVGEDKPWGVDMNGALKMLELGCKGSGWSWSKRMPKDRNPLDEIVKDQDVAVQVDETVKPQVFPTRLIRRFTTGTVERTTTPRIKRTKTCSVVPVTDYPYGTRINVGGVPLELYM